MYMHSQMIARYNVESLAWGLDITHSWGYNDVLTYGHTPPPILQEAYASRPPFQGWYEKHNPLIPENANPPPSKETMINWCDNVFSALKRGSFATRQSLAKDALPGEPLELTPDTAMNWLGIVLEAEVECLQQVPNGGYIDSGLYGNIHNQGHDKFGEIGFQSLGSRWSVMDGNYASPRDPCFWLWHRHIESFREVIVRKYPRRITTQPSPQAKIKSLKILPNCLKT